MMPVLEAMNQTVRAEILGGAEAGDSAVTVSGICFVIMPEGAAARGGICTTRQSGSWPRARGRSKGQSELAPDTANRVRRGTRCLRSPCPSGRGGLH
jgi:hypothetical protein